MQVNNIVHLFRHCKEKNYLPLDCSVSKTVTPELTQCTCDGEKHHSAYVKIFTFNTSDMWNHFPCRITTDYTLLLKNQAKNMVLTSWLSVLIFLFLSSIAIFIILKIKNKLIQRHEDQMVMSLLPD